MADGKGKVGRKFVEAVLLLDALLKRHASCGRSSSGLEVGLIKKLMWYFLKCGYEIGTSYWYSDAKLKMLVKRGGAYSFVFLIDFVRIVLFYRN